MQLLMEWCRKVMLSEAQALSLGDDNDCNCVYMAVVFHVSILRS